MKYDVIVIGGGLGGLMAGITAAKKARRRSFLKSMSPSVGWPPALRERATISMPA